MKQKTRKLLSRIGAALMLGMSLFNFGMIWSKKSVERVPRKTRNMRKQTEEVDVEVQEIADLAEREAQIVMLTEQLSERESQQQLQDEETIFAPKFFRYAAISLWVFSATILFSSAVFDYPFIVGKGMLSLLPGIPHTAKVTLKTSQEQYQIGDQASVFAYLDTRGDQVEFIKLSLVYNSEQLSLDGFSANKEYFEIVDRQNVDGESGRANFLIKTKGKGAAFDEKKLAAIRFKTTQKSADSAINLNKGESVVVKADNKRNILGKIKNVSFSIVE